MVDNIALFFTVAFTASSLTFIQFYWLKVFSRKLRHPPSPKTLPVLGNALSIPPGLDHLTYLEFGKQLNSDIVYMNMMGQSLVVLNTAQAASDLLDKRSAIYSDRVCAPMVKNPTLLDWSGFAGMLPYSDLWRRQRRRVNNWLNIRAVRQFDHLQQDVVRSMLGRIHDISGSTELFEKVKHQFFFAMASATFRLAYGYHIQSDQDPFFLDAVQASDNLFAATMMGNFLVNAFPALSYIPQWLPGAGWKRIAKKWREHKNRAVDTPYEWTKNQVASGNFEPSVLSALLQDEKIDQGLSQEERDKELKELAYVLFLGGTGTSATALVNFVAAMVLNPEVQAKAQAELDSVLGYASRLPTMSDETQLPYIRNLILEVHRWQPVGPTGGPPHACYQDDVYQGYNIQKGTIVMGNLWAMTRDETVYQDPEHFNPDRFLDSNIPPVPTYGWGRRKCPGMHFAEASLFLAISSLLTNFNFLRKKDKEGKEIIPTIEGSCNSLAVPIKPFEFELRLRSKDHNQLILDNVTAKSTNVSVSK
ncbi:cytochrome P450 family protein [Rhizoctonia solani]|uniref:Cytochrome P450 family protein n=1 Tax=Rhizoctonia solani TaxID=456999 RepID=A0A8H8P2F3_9AGAM|nr:cytochrome P450 family protein [Rhizoctonia solani]QRW23980.1 cytochrome P450 family protein [Rhizoctonia solani]